MKIKFNTSVAGERFAYRNKQIVDLRPDLAKAFITAGQAVKVEEEVPPGIRKTRRGGRIVELAVTNAGEQRG